mgnify:CR=1 FL=1
MANQAPYIDTAPTRDQALAAIDWEIAQARANETQPGWTQWLLHASLAATFWALINQPNIIGMFDFRLSVHYTLIGTAILATGLAHNITTNPHPTTNKRPFGVASSLAHHRTAHIIRAITTTFYAIVLNTGRSELYLASLLAKIFFIMSLLSILFTTMTMFDIRLKLETTSSSQRIITTVPFIGAFGLTAYSTARWSYQDLSINPNIAVTSFKAAALLYAITRLLQLASGPREPIITYKQLTSIRRDLAFNKISAGDAISQADVVIYGHKLQDLFRTEVNGLLGIANELAKQSHAITIALDGAKHQLDITTHSNTNEALTLAVKNARGYLELLDAPLSDHEWNYKELARKINKLVTRVRIMSSKEHSFEVEDLVAMLREKFITPTESRIQEYNRIAAEINTALTAAEKRLKTLDGAQSDTNTEDVNGQ